MCKFFFLPPCLILFFLFQKIILIFNFLKYLIWHIGIISFSDCLLCNFKLNIIFIWFSIDSINFCCLIVFTRCKIKVSGIFIRFLPFYRNFFIMFWPIRCIFLITCSFFSPFRPIFILKLKIWVQICMSKLHLSLNLAFVDII